MLVGTYLDSDFDCTNFTVRHACHRAPHLSTHQQGMSENAPSFNPAHGPLPPSSALLGSPPGHSVLSSCLRRKTPACETAAAAAATSHDIVDLRGGREVGGTWGIWALSAADMPRAR